MSMPCPKCGAEVYREDNYECLCEDQQDDELTEANARIAELKAHDLEMQESVSCNNNRMWDMSKELRDLQAQIKAAVGVLKDEKVGHTWGPTYEITIVRALEALTSETGGE